jgi:hypothetical protein
MMEPMLSLRDQMDATIMNHNTHSPSLFHKKLMKTPSGVCLQVREDCVIDGDTHGDDWHDKPHRPHEVDKVPHWYVHSFGSILEVYFKGYKCLAMIMMRSVASLKGI